MTWPHGDPDAVVRGVLADPAYRDAAATSSVRPHPSLLREVLEWLWQHVLRPLLHPIAHAVATSRGVGTVVGAVLIVLSLAVLGFVVFRLAFAFARTPSRGVRGAAAGSDAVERSARAWRDLARAAAARGEFGPAIAALFGAALADLDARALVAFDAARTPGEYRRLVARVRAAASPPFDDLTDRFVRASYAPGTPLAAEYEAAERALAALEPALG